MKKRIRILLALVLLCALLPLPAVQASEEQNDGTYTYTVNNGEAALTGVCTGVKLNGSVTLPSVYKDTPVVEICTWAITNQDGITELIVPDSVHTVAADAFFELNNLRQIVIPASVTELGTSFLGGRCEALSEVYVYGTSYERFTYYDTGHAISLYIDADLNDPEYPVIYGQIYPLGEIAFDPRTAVTQTQDGFSFVISDGKATVTDAPKSGAVTIPDTLGGAPVCFLYPNLYYGATELTEVKLPETVREIPYCCFSHCSALRTIDLSHVTRIRAEAFDGCSSLQTLTLSGACKRVERHGFMMNDFTELNLPEGLEYIGEGAFHKSEHCTRISLPSTLKHIGNAAFSQTKTDRLVLPDALEEIGSYAFHQSFHCDLNINGTVKFIGSAAFSGCTVPKLEVSGSVGNIWDECFANSHIGSVVLHEGTKRIGARAFSGAQLTQLTLPEGLEEIGESAFGYNGSLQTLTVPGSVVRCDNAFDNSFIGIVYGSNAQVEEAALLGGCRYIDLLTGKESQGPYYKTVDGVTYHVMLKEALLTDGSGAAGELLVPEEIDGKPVTQILEWAFRRNHALTAIELPDSVTSVGKAVFFECINLERAILGNGIEILPDSFFARCSALSDIQLPENLKEIRQAAFSGCRNLYSIWLPDTVEAVADAFSDCALRMLYLPPSFTDRLCYGFEGEDDYIQLVADTCYLVYEKGTPAETYVNKLREHYWDKQSVLAYELPENEELYMTPNAIYRRDGDEMTLLFCPLLSGESLSSVVLEDTVAELPVTTVAEGAFVQNTALGFGTQVILGNHVRKVEARAFSALLCSGKVWFPDSLEELDPEAFSGADGFSLIGKPGGPVEQFAEEHKEYGFTFFDNRIHPFEDLALTWYYNPVLWAYYHAPQITNGTSEHLFSPRGFCTRGQFVTFLWRAMGESYVEAAENPFTDVTQGDYWYDAVLWAVENGITNGVTETSFGPKQQCTRAQVLTFLWRALGRPAPQNTDVPFVDVREGFYYDAMLWAVENEITNGTSDTRFSPNDYCNRAQVVTFLYRCDALAAMMQPD